MAMVSHPSVERIFLWILWVGNNCMLKPRAMPFDVAYSPVPMMYPTCELVLSGPTFMNPKSPTQ